jgi:ATP-dependent DNA ligase
MLGATEEIKLDGYRIEVVRTGGGTTLYSRRQNVLNHKFHYIAKALDYLPADTVLDGELVAMGPDGKPNFNLLQNFKSAELHITYYAFDVLMHKGRDLTQVPLSERRALLRTVLKPSDHVALSEVSDRTAAEMLKFVKSHGLEGVVAKCHAAPKSRIADPYFSALSAFCCKVIALKSRKTFATKFVSDLDAEVALAGDGVRVRLGP